MAPLAWTQTLSTGGPCCEADKAAGTSATPYTIHGATPEQESALRTEVQIMKPEILPSRIVFVPHWQYVNAARIYRLRVPTGMSSKMFTYLPGRTVYIDADLCGSNGWLGYWMAHELGHLATNSAKEDDAERAAREYRRRLKDARKGDPHSGSSN
jgi:hypothetical protein